MEWSHDTGDYYIINISYKRMWERKGVKKGSKWSKMSRKFNMFVVIGGVKNNLVGKVSVIFYTFREKGRPRPICKLFGTPDFNSGMVWSVE